MKADAPCNLESWRNCKQFPAACGTCERSFHRYSPPSCSAFSSPTMRAMASPGGNPKKVDYPTPQEWYDYLNLEFGFTLDPCCAHGTAKCKKHYTEDEDGLSKSWADERVFMNPPYGRNIAPWMAKAYEESKRGALVVCFVPARVDTNWWHDYAIRGEVRLPKGRCKNADGSAWPFPIAIVIFRPHTYTPNTATVRTAEQIREACDCVEAVGVGLERKSPEQQAYRNGYLNSQHDIRKALLGEAGVKQ